MNSKRFTILTLCVVCVFTLLMSGYTTAQGTDSFSAEDVVPLYLNGIKAADGYKVGDTTYVSIRSFAEALCEDIDTTWDTETQTLSLSAENLELTAAVGSLYVVANGRYLLVAEGVKLYGDNVVVPIRTIAQVFGAEIEWNEKSLSVSIIPGASGIIESGDTFYNENDLYWLSRLINSEAGNQIMEGKIAVGNVVLNRVASPICPDTIYDVIFDSKYGVQFSVVPTGAIYQEPNDESIIAAKICLEGGNLVGEDCIYFVNPIIGAASWFKTTRTFIGSFGDHDFYA